MAIRCPRCGLEYDVALFQFGRTLDCACGARVGLELREIRPSPASERRFLCDGMLMGLARWLRLLGYDTVCDPALSDRETVRRCYEEGRVLLTRDRKLGRKWRVPELCVVEADRPLLQVEEVASRYELRLDERLLTRCSRCNVAVERVAVPEIGAELSRAALPPDVADGGRPITRCPDCGRLYWEGSHVARMRRVLSERLDAAKRRA